MSRIESSILYLLRNALVELNATEVDELLQESLSLQLDPVEVLDVLRSGMEEVGRLFEDGEYFVSELVMAGEIMKRALDVLKPYLKAECEGTGKIVLGTIIGDLHDIGKGIVKSLLLAAGFEVYDLGVDVPPERFVKKAKETGAEIIGISALLSTSIVNTAEVVKALEKAGIRSRVKVIVGGAAARPWMTEKYGVDAAVNDAVNGLKIIKGWTKKDELA